MAPRRRIPHLLILLRKESAAIVALLARFERLRKHTRAPLEALVDDACEEIELHMMLAEQILYPALKSARRAKTAPAIEEFEAEHLCLRALLAELRRLPSEDPEYTSAFIVLARHARLHLRAEQRQLFALARHTRLDLEELGLRAQTLRKSLRGEQDVARTPAATGADAEAAERHSRGEKRYRDVARH